MLRCVVCPSLGEQESAFRIWDWAPQFHGGFDPLLNHELGIRQGLLPGEAVSRTAGQLRHLGDEGVIFSAPIKNDLVFRHSTPSASLYRMISARTCLTW